MDDDIQRHAQAIRESGVLGRSDVLTRLFDFLVVSAERKPTLTEAEIAAELFGRAHAFDPAEDARVRGQRPSAAQEARPVLRKWGR